jgi:hypothetical protein
MTSASPVVERLRRAWAAPVDGQVTRWLYLRALALCYLAAFLSLWSQIDGLIGSDGILPAADYLERVRANFDGDAPWTRVPTLAWLSASDGALHGICALGGIAALTLLLNVAPLLSLVVLWVAYLSLASVGQVFLGYQWDNLLLEVGFLSIFYAPVGLRPTIERAAPVPRLALWVLRFTLFKVMLSSGIVKLSSQDPTWHGLTALTYHYWTQPIPHAGGWWAHQLPLWAHQVSAAGMFVVELVCPFFVAAPSRARFLGAFVPIVGLMVGIGLTGSYGFFGILTVALCVTLLDDRLLARVTGLPESGGAPRTGARALAWLSVPVALVWVVVGGFQTAGRMRVKMPAPVAAVASAVRPTRSLSSYGLFARMTTDRPEIEVQGSRDGEDWETYRFRYKAGAVDKIAGPAGVHMPRIDWQMWFAALRGRCERAYWYQRFAYRLLTGAGPVAGLLAHDPFPDEPPRYIRSIRYQYTFSDTDTREASGAWWTREQAGEYCPVLTVDSFRRR